MRIGVSYGILVGDALVHLEEVVVALPHDVVAEALDGGPEVEVDAVLQRADAAAGVALGLERPRCDVAGHEVAERRVATLEEVVAVAFGDLRRRPGVVHLLRHPHPAVVAQRLRHQRELRLEVVARRDARRVDLRVAGVGEQRPLLVGPPHGGDVARLGVGGEEEDVAVAARGEDHRVGAVALDDAGVQVAGDDADGAAVLGDEVEHLAAVVQRDGACPDLAGERLVGAEQQLLAGLAAGVEGARHLGAAEAAVVEQAAVLAGERHALGDALVDDVDRHLGEAVHVGLTGPVVAALHGVVEEAVDGVAVALVGLRRVDAALGGDGVGPTGGVVVGEGVDVVAELAEGGGGRATGEPGADDDHLEPAAVVRRHQLHVELVLGPLVLRSDRSGTLRSRA